MLYLDLAAAMIEAADDGEGRYDGRNVGVVNTGGRARFPTGTFFEHADCSMEPRVRRLLTLVLL